MEGRLALIQVVLCFCICSKSEVGVARNLDLVMRDFLWVGRGEGIKENLSVGFSVHVRQER